MTSTITPFAATRAPCGHQHRGERSVSEDEQGLITEEVTYSCGCRVSKEEFHDGSVHRMVVNHRGRVLFEEELRGE
jgi:hypothetical protein